MSEDVIKLTVDYSELDIAIAKAKQVIVLSSKTFGTPDFSKGTSKMWKDWQAFNNMNNQLLGDIPDFVRLFGTSDLPSLNREMRLLYGQVPMMRNIMWQYFRVKRIQENLGKAVKDATLLREVIANPDLLITLVATFVVILKSVLTIHERLKREKQEYEEFIRREQGLSKREFDSLRGRLEKVAPGAGTGERGEYYWSTP